MNFEKIIYWLLEELGLEYVFVDRDGKTPYIHCQSPLPDVEDASPSFQIYLDGFCLSHNANVDGKNRFHIKKVFKQNGYMSEYVQWILQENQIAVYHLNEYRDMLVKKTIGESYDYKKFNKLKQVFGDLFLSESDIIGASEIRSPHKNKFELKKKKKRRKSNMKEVEITQNEFQQCLEYLKSRKIEYIKDKVEPTKIEFESKNSSKPYNILGIALRYPDDMVKYRLLSDSFRYVSKGIYDNFFIAQESNDKVLCYICEGEFESLSLVESTNKTVFSMHNCNSINEGGLKQLIDYERIIIFVDYDNYSKVREGLLNQVKKKYPNKKVICIPKFESNDKKLDFNKYLIDNGEKKFKEYLKKYLTGKI